MDSHAQILGVEKPAESNFKQALRHGRTSLHIGTVLGEARKPRLDYRAVYKMRNSFLSRNGNCSL